MAVILLSSSRVKVTWIPRRAKRPDCQLIIASDACLPTTEWLVQWIWSKIHRCKSRTNFVFPHGWWSSKPGILWRCPWICGSRRSLLMKIIYLSSSFQVLNDHRIDVEYFRGGGQFTQETFSDHLPSRWWSWSSLTQHWPEQTVVAGSIVANTISWLKVALFLFSFYFFFFFPPPLLSPAKTASSELW